MTLRKISGIVRAVAGLDFQDLVDRLVGGTLADELTKRRGRGESYRTIARWLAAEHDIDTTDQTIRRWCNDLGIEKSEAAAS